MGTWGTAAWENDRAADWFANIFDATELAKKVEETLYCNPEVHYNKIRAAAYILVTLGRVFIWPVHDLDLHIALAINGLEEIQKLEIFRDRPEFVEAIDQEIEALRLRL